jgi:multidrug efflux pump subunit AcrA (membrane-fusion protein)
VNHRPSAATIPANPRPVRTSALLRPDPGRDNEGKVTLCKLDIEYDNGTDLEVREGLKAGDRVIVNPPATVRDGMRVQTQTPRMAEENTG